MPQMDTTPRALPHHRASPGAARTFARQAGIASVRALACVGMMIALSLTLGRAPAAAQAQTRDAAAVVRRLYRDHFSHQQNWDDTFRRQRLLFDRSLAAALDEDLRASAANHDEVVGLDFDPLTNSQDSMEGYEVSPAGRSGNDALVRVVMRYDTLRAPVVVRLGRAGNVWRIKNFEYPTGDLATILEQLADERKKNRP